MVRCRCPASRTATKYHDKEVRSGYVMAWPIATSPSHFMQASRCGEDNAMRPRFHVLAHPSALRRGQEGAGCSLDLYTHHCQLPACRRIQDLRACRFAILYNDTILQGTIRRKRLRHKISSLHALLCSSMPGCILGSLSLFLSGSYGERRGTMPACVCGDMWWAT